MFTISGRRNSEAILRNESIPFVPSFNSTLKEHLTLPYLLTFIGRIVIYSLKVSILESFYILYWAKNWEGGQLMGGGGCAFQKQKNDSGGNFSMTRHQRETRCKQMQGNMFFNRRFSEI